MTRCDVCGRENDDSFRFCLDCGTTLHGEAEPTPAVAEPAAPRRPIPLTRPAPPTSFQPMATARTAPAPEPQAAPPAPQVAPSPTETSAPAVGGAACRECGAPLIAGHVFCGTCGARVQSAPAVEGSGTAFMHAGDAARLSQSRFVLVVVRADGTEGARFELGTGRAVAGRAGPEVTLDDPYVSDAHAAFDLRDGDLVVSDLGTPSGTYLKVAPGEQIRAGDGTVLRVGRQLLTLEAMPLDRSGEEGREWGSPDPGYLLRVVQHHEGGGTGNVWPLAEGTYQIGREAGELVFPGDGFISGRHGRLTVGPAGRATFEDTGSSNGSFVRLAQETRLRPGDMLLMGSHLLRVEAH